VGWGITSVSVNPDVLEKTRGIIAAAEQRLVKTI
jgi:phosphoenolpyruvate synthase/pyruvate phosphate dikinase